MDQRGQGPLGPFALYLLRPTWIGGEPKAAQFGTVAWRQMGLQEVPVTALKDGFIIFEFNESANYAGGAVPGYKLPEDRRVPADVTRASRGRDDLAYRRFKYMNAFLLALYSGVSTYRKLQNRRKNRWTRRIISELNEPQTDGGLFRSREG